jgi:hypothetical protein
MFRRNICAIFVVFLFLATPGTFAVSAAAQEFTGAITGTVIDAQGKSVAGAWVTIGCGNRPLGGRIPGAVSDANGRFAVGSLELTDCSVYACNEQADIPCLSPVNPARVPQITLTAVVPSADVRVQLGEKGTVITGTVRDANTGEKLDAMFEYYQLKFPGQKSSMSSGADYRIFIAPSTDYGLKISAPGHQSWSYAHHRLWHRAIRLAAHSHLYLDVKLKSAR